MTTPEKITSEIMKLEPSAIIELFELDATTLGGDVYYFHAGTNELKGGIVWQGQEYARYPIEVRGFEVNSQGTLPRPTMQVANLLGSITTLLLAFKDLLGARVTRRRTLKKYLDAENFASGVNPDADPSAGFADDIFNVDRKASETRESVTLELSAALDMPNVRVPFRQIIQNVCQWKYRSAECGYAGDDYFDILDNPVSTLAEDRCGKRLGSCKLRFGEYGQINFGGFPSASLLK